MLYCTQAIIRHSLISYSGNKVPYHLTKAVQASVPVAVQVSLLIVEQLS
jgi:hypothetical protein